MRPVEAIILAAGSGRRLGPATMGRPKCLVEVGGRSILERQLTSFGQMGVERFVIVCGYEADQVARVARDLCGDAVEIVLNDRYADTNVLTSWLLGSAHLFGDHYYAHADTVFDVALLRRLRQLGESAINLTYDRHACGEEEMKVRCEGSQLEAISKTMPSDMAAGEFTGVMSVQAAALQELRTIGGQLLQSDQADSLFVEAVLQELLDRGRANLFSLVDITGIPWREVDFPEDLSAADRLFAASD
jgi:choline kinase